MKKMIIGGLVGGLILFLWQFLSWSGLNIHRSQTQYTPVQNEVLECLQANNLPEGSFFLPNVPENTSSEDHQKAMESFIGNPWATITYHHSMEANMAMNMFRGYIVDFLSVFLLCFILLGNPALDFKKVMITTVGVGLISYMTMPYLESIWFQGNSIPDLIDALVQWSVAGLFLAWYLPRKAN